MTASSRPAVFVSYASQDVAAARALVAALRAAGLEVWFDENELTSGDAWDAKIRGQIRSCALFVPLISANTEVRLEGYFRREWKLAVDRTHDMADEKTFLVPVVIDGTAQETARVPGKFRDYQWTRLPAGAPTEKFVRQIVVLLDPDAPAPALAPAAPRPAASAAAPRPPAPARRIPRLGGAVVALVAVALGFFWRRENPRHPAPGAPAPAASPAQAPAAGPDTTRILDQALGLMQGNETVPADLALAEDLIKGVLATHPTDPAATTMMARLQGYYLLRGFDRSDVRFDLAKTYSTRALTLSPGDADAQAAMATYLYRRGIDQEQALRLTRAAIAGRPDDPYAYRLLDNLLARDAKIGDQEVIASALVTAKKFPRDALVQYELARHYRDSGMLAEAEQYLRLAVELGPVPNAIIALANLQLFNHGSLAGMRRLLDQVPERSRSTDRAVVAEYIYAQVSGDSARGEGALYRLTTPWIIDFDYTGPAALLWGELLLSQGKAELAQLKYQEALAELGRHPPDLTRNFSTLWLDAWLLMRLGRLEEARARSAVMLAEIAHHFRIGLGTGWWFNPIALTLLLGDIDQSASLIRDAAVTPEEKAVVRTCLQIDPRLRKFRDDEKLLAALATPGK